MSEHYNALLLNKILSDFQKGEKHKSLKQIIQFVDKNPSDNTARYNLALMYEMMGNINLAIANYKKVTSNDKNHWRSRFNLYLILIKQKKFTDALQLINEVLFINQNYQPALRDKAVALLFLNRPDEGLPYILNSLKKNPLDYIALNTLGLIYLNINKIKDAEKIFLKAIETKPEYINSYNNLGRCYSLQNNYKKALKYFQIALDKNPNFFEAINNIANEYSAAGYYKKALEFYFKILKNNENNHELLYNIGVAYARLKEFNRAESYYKKSYAINPKDEKLNENYAILLLGLQRFKEAWELYDGRLYLEKFKSKNNHIHNIKHKLWKKERLNANNNILVIKEQGVGDEILHSSMYPDFIKRFPNSKIETDPRLISLFERSFKTTNRFVPYSTYSKDKKAMKNFDTVIYAGSLGRIFRNNLSDFPKNHFLNCDKIKYQDINKKITQINQKIKIGISWRSKNETYGSAKSLDLNLLKPIIELKDIAFINLQYGSTLDEIDNFYSKTKLKIFNIDDVDLYNDFESIAALLKNLDLFVSVSNTTAHLSGALDVPTWIIKPKNHAVFHYWNQPSNTTPWYSSIKLYPYENEWIETIDCIKKDIISKFKLK